MKAVLSSVYCGSIEYYSVLNNAEEVLIDSHEHYAKQTYRNRCEIYGANGKLNLTIPLVRRGKRVAVHDAQIENDFGWRKLHWRSIESAYRSSPYFEFYEHHFIPIFEKEHTHLFQLNQEIQNKISKRITFELSKYLKFISDSLMKLLSINVRNVKKPIDKVIINNKII